MMFIHVDNQVDMALHILRSAISDYEDYFHSNTSASYFAYVGVLECIDFEANPEQIQDEFIYSCFEKLERLLDLPDSRNKLGPAKYINGKMECYFYRIVRNEPGNISDEVLEWFQDTSQEINRVSFESPISLIYRGKLLLLLGFVLMQDEDREVDHDCINLVIEYIQRLCSRPSHVSHYEYVQILGLFRHLHGLQGLSNEDHKFISQTFLSLLNGLSPEMKSELFSLIPFSLAYHWCATKHVYAGESSYFSDLFSIIEPYVIDGTIRDANLAAIIASYNVCLESIQEDRETFTSFHSELPKVLSAIDSITDLENRISGISLNNQSRFFSNLAVCCLYLKNTSSADKYLSLARSFYVEPDLDENFFSHEFSPFICELKFKIELLQVVSLVQQNKIFEATELATSTFSNLWDFNNSVGARKQFSNQEGWDYLGTKLFSRLLSLMGLTSYLNGDFDIARIQLVHSNEYLSYSSAFSHDHELFKINFGYIRLCGLASGSPFRLSTIQFVIDLLSVEIPQWANVEPSGLESAITIYEH
jgi:hypothetical protein